MPQAVEARGAAALELKLEWQSEQASHDERLYASVGIWSDMLPGDLARQLVGKTAGQSAQVELGPGEMPPRDERFIRKLANWQFKGQGKPRLGRFYPNGVLAGLVTQVGPADKPFRVIELAEDGFTCNFNSPMAGRRAKVTATVLAPDISARELSPECVEWLHRLTVGPGMQVDCPNGPTDFLDEEGLAREDQAPDPDFYQKPRLVGHVDSLASQHLGGLYAELVPQGGKVLDLMSSYQSHLPADFPAAEVVGLGLNQEEMAANPRLSSHLTHDLNADPALPFADGEFDAVLLSLSIEYLLDPAKVVLEAARVLKPGGVFAVTFSNRFFPPKAVAMWKELHDFERLGYALALLRDSGRFQGLATRSWRGWLRPTDDRHFPELRLSDPVYAVWGSKA